MRASRWTGTGTVASNNTHMQKENCPVPEVLPAHVLLLQQHLRRAIHEVCLTFCTCLAFAAKAQGWAFICLHSYCSQLHSGKLFVMQLKTCTHLDWWELNVVTNGKAGWKQTARSSAQTSLAPVFVMCYFTAKALLLLFCVKLFTVQLLAK